MYTVQCLIYTCICITQVCLYFRSSEIRDSLNADLKKEKKMYVNKKYKERLVTIRQELVNTNVYDSNQCPRFVIYAVICSYEKKAIANGLPVTKYYHKTFQKFKG